MAFFIASLIVAFVGGMIALFAPCCISYLFPAYLGAIVKERSRRLLGTLLFTLGLATMMVPTTLGFWTFLRFFQNNHEQVYIAGGGFMMILGLLSFSRLQIKLPMVQLPTLSTQSSLWMFYPLGLLSGLTSICCAPVLAGAMTLGAISPTFFQSLAIAFAYTFGIVTPLFLGTFIVEAKALTRVRQWLMQPLWGKPRSDIIAGVLFLGIGVATIILALTGSIAMPDMTSNFGRTINQWIVNVSQWLTR